MCVYVHFLVKESMAFAAYEKLFDPEKINTYHGLPSVFVISVDPVSMY